MASTTVHHDLIDQTQIRPQLPAEIFSLIISYSRRGSQAVTARASRRLFNLVIPHLWHNVDLINVLGLLSGSSYDYPPTPASFQVEMPRILPEDYFARLKVYAPHVTSLCFCHAWYVAEDYSRHQVAWPAIARYTADQAMLPNLKTLILGGNGCLSRHLDVSLDWISALVLPGKKLVHCIFDLQLDGTSAGVAEKARAILNKLFSSSDTLIVLSLRSYHLCDMALPFDPGDFPLRAPQALVYLFITSDLLTTSSLTWISEMTNLGMLQILPPGLTAQQAEKASSA
ncbi:hypothetical protein FS749_007280, partial [Ceratobasidium sp. UAMH 11750]